MLRLPALLFLASAGAPAAAQAHAPRSVDDVPRVRRTLDPAGDGAVGIEFDPRAYDQLAELHAREASFTIDDLPLPDGRSVDVELVPVRTACGTALVVQRHGEIAHVAPDVLCFAGFVSGGGPAFLGVTGSAWNGYVVVDGEVYFLSPGEHLAPGEAVLTGASGATNSLEDFCGTLGPRGTSVPDVETATAGGLLRTAELFVEADHRVRARFDSDQECVDYVALLFTATSEIYRRDTGVRLEIPDGYLRVWNVVPPWGTITGFASIDRVFDWWTSAENPLRDIPRASVTVLTNPIFGGVAKGVGGLCDDDRAFQIASIAGRFPYPVQHRHRDNWDLFVVAHELGHTFGSPHSSLYSPPIQCADGSGPDSGTIMSYCHNDYGVAGVGMRFHLREQQRIVGLLGNRACLTVQTLAPGDYDGDGDRDSLDMAVARGVLEQGFRSLGAEDALDMDGDGDFDQADVDRLARLTGEDPRASWSVRNGSGVNETCYAAVGRPVLGSTWNTVVDAAGTGRETCVTVCLDPLPGVKMPWGELLVRTAPHGGLVLLRDYSTSDGVISVHSMPLPLELSLVGLTASTQALVLEGSDGVHFCNAIDVTFGSW